MVFALFNFKQPSSEEAQGWMMTDAKMYGARAAGQLCALLR